MTEHSEYHAPPPRDDEPLVDDVLAEKNPAFDESLVDSRPIGDWQINASAAVVRLDCPMVKPDAEAAMLELRPSYRAAMTAAGDLRFNLLPSANMLDGAAKQFDDGLYAALDLACFRGELGLAPAAPDWAAAVLGQLPKTSPARPFLAAALELAGKGAELTAAERNAKDGWLAEFDENKAASKPISFYDWTPELTQVWRFYRFLQHEFPQDKLAIPRDVAAVLKGNAQLRKQHHAINAFYGRLTNPLICLPVDALIDAQESLPELAKRHGAARVGGRLSPLDQPRNRALRSHVSPGRAFRREPDGRADRPHPLGPGRFETRPERRLVSVPGVRAGDAAAAGQRSGEGQAAPDGGLQEAAHRGVQGDDHHAARDARAAGCEDRGKVRGTRAAQRTRGAPAAAG